MLEPLYNLPLRLQTLHSKELKQEIASWCPPQTEFIEANRLPKFFSSQTLERSNCLVGWSSTWTVWSVRGGDWLFICSWDWQDLLAAQGWHQAWVSNQRAQSESCPSHEVEREQWEILVAIGEGPKVFWPDELTWQELSEPVMAPGWHAEILHPRPWHPRGTVYLNIGPQGI